MVISHAITEQHHQTVISLTLVSSRQTSSIAFMYILKWLKLNGFLLVMGKVRRKDVPCIPSPPLYYVPLRDLLNPDEIKHLHLACSLCTTLHTTSPSVLLPCVSQHTSSPSLSPPPKDKAELLEHCSCAYFAGMSLNVQVSSHERSPTSGPLLVIVLLCMQCTNHHRSTQ